MIGFCINLFVISVLIGAAFASRRNEASYMVRDVWYYILDSFRTLILGKRVVIKDQCTFIRPTEDEQRILALCVIDPNHAYITLNDLDEYSGVKSVYPFLYSHYYVENNDFTINDETGCIAVKKAVFTPIKLSAKNTRIQRAVCNYIRGRKNE